MKAVGQACFSERCIYLPTRLLTGKRFFRTHDIVDTLAHEYLHVYVNEQIGFGKYIATEFITAPFSPRGPSIGQIHNWIYDQGELIGRYNFVGGRIMKKPGLPALDVDN